MVFMIQYWAVEGPVGVIHMSYHHSRKVVLLCVCKPLMRATQTLSHRQQTCRHLFVGFRMQNHYHFCLLLYTMFMPTLRIHPIKQTCYRITASCWRYIASAIMQKHIILRTCANLCIQNYESTATWMLYRAWPFLSFDAVIIVIKSYVNER